MAAGQENERTLEETATWAVEVVCFGLLSISIFIEHIIHAIGKNAFQLALFAYTSYAFGIRSCFHREIQNIVIRLTTGVIIQILCSNVTLLLYALVTQMGSTMKPTIFNERVAAALKNWHHTAGKQVKEYSRHSGTNTPLSSAPAMPNHCMSPVHLLHKHAGARSDRVPTSPRGFANERWDLIWKKGHPPTTMEGHEIRMLIPTSSHQHDD